MTRWFRFYDCVLDDPKVQRLDPPAFKLWVNVLCAASKNGGRLPRMADLAFMLRLTEKNAALALAELMQFGLIEKDETGYFPHNWNARQFKSDDVTERVRKHRKKRDGNVSCNVSGNAEPLLHGTPPETDTDTEGSVANATGADAPLDPTERCWAEAIPALTAMAVGERDARSNVGRWLKEHPPDAVLGAVYRARDHGTKDPIPLVGRILKPLQTNGNGNGKAPSLADYAKANQQRLRAAERDDGAKSPVLALGHR